MSIGGDDLLGTILFFTFIALCGLTLLVLALVCVTPLSLRLVWCVLQCDRRMGWNYFAEERRMFARRPSCWEFLGRVFMGRNLPD